ncbi:MAG: DUF177 domain-containing protein [Clostridia bacterium]|nr:DUF177 domain-containing protein [Clostridia bacterium]
MVLDVRPLLRGETDHIDFDYYLTPDPIDDVTFSSDAHISGRITDNAGYMRLVLSASADYTGRCARCLKTVEGNFRIDFERTVCNEGTLTDERARADEEDVYSDGYAVIHGGMLDIDEELREEMVLSFPTKLLCSEECEGLCPMCGKPRSEGKCSCVKKEIDPRLAVLATLLHKDEKDGENQ